ncbi:hypothetical protein CLV00_2240 [Flavobacterium sp. 11]|nr:hypothetical protein CLV00_2240 [Flavobacterium sp. 11]
MKNDDFNLYYNVSFYKGSGLVIKINSVHFLLFYLRNVKIKTIKI